MNDIQVDIDIKELYQTFLDLEGNIKESPEIKQAIRRGSSYLKNQAKQRLSSRLIDKSRNTLYSSIAVHNHIGKKNVGLVVYVKRDKMYKGLPNALDFGTKRRTTKSGANRGYITATRFWQDTKENDVGKVQNDIMAAVSDAINKIMSR